MPLPHQILYSAAMVLVCGFTIWAGGWPERVGLAIHCAASALSYPASVLTPSRWQHLMPLTLAVDVATSLAFLVLMLKSSRFWPVWAVGFCLAMVMAHLTRAFERVLPAWSYYQSAGIWAYPVMVSIMIGAAGHRWRKPTAAF